MATTVIEDLIVDSSGGRNEDGYEGFVRVFHVQGLVGRSTSRIPLALTATGIPQRGDGHPSTRWIVVDQLNARIIDGDPTSARVVVRYVPVKLFVPDKPITPSSTDPLAATFSVGSVLQTVETKVDKDRKPLIVKYTTLGENNEPTTTKKIVTAQIQVPMNTFTYDRDETLSIEELQDKSAKFVGRLNKTITFRDPVRTWMCMAIVGTTQSPEQVSGQVLPLGKPTFHVEYSFQRSEPDETWDTSRLYYFTRNGEVPDDVVIGGNGTLTGIKHYEVVEFRDMNLTF